MDWICKAALTAGTVFAVATAARYLGQRAAGILAALPIITAPTLAWVSHEQGLGFAVSAAIGSVSACAMMAIFALAYACGSRRGGVATALAFGLAGALAVGLPAAIVSAELGQSLALALTCCSCAIVSLRVDSTAVTRIDRSRVAPMAVALVAGGLSALAVTIGPKLGGFTTGLLSSLPVIGGGVAILEHATNGPRAAEQFLYGYVRGLFGKTAFGAVFALLAANVGSTVALVLASVAACVLLHRWSLPLPRSLRCVRRPRLAE